MISELTIYGRSNCHLCQDMMDELQPLVQRYGLTVSRVDIDGCAELEARFGQIVPVLTAGGREICHFRLDVRALERFLKGRSA